MVDSIESPSVSVTIWAEAVSAGRVRINVLSEASQDSSELMTELAARAYKPPSLQTAIGTILFPGIGILAGGALGPLLGAILAAPAITAVASVIKTFITRKAGRSVQLYQPNGLPALTIKGDMSVDEISRLLREQATYIAPMSSREARDGGAEDGEK